MRKPRTCLYDTVVEDRMAVLPLCLAGDGHAVVKRNVCHEKKADVGNASGFNVAGKLQCYKRTDLILLSFTPVRRT
jgi:hypothetical protein